MSDQLDTLSRAVKCTSCGAVHSEEVLAVVATEHRADAYNNMKKLENEVMMESIRPALESLVEQFEKDTDK